MIKINVGTLPKLLQKLCTQNKRYGSRSPRKNGFAESSANVSDEIPETSEDCLSINICKMAVASTADKEHTQQMSNTADELLAVVKNQKSQIYELIKQNGQLTGVEKLDKGTNINRRQHGRKLKKKIRPQQLDRKESAKFAETNTTHPPIDNWIPIRTGALQIGRADWNSIRRGWNQLTIRSTVRD